MKRLFMMICTVLAMGPLSCYIVNTERGTSRVLLASNFPAGVTALHVGVFQGTATEENLLAYQVFYPGTTVALNVPAGSSRVFVIWGEGSNGIATYYGYAGPLSTGDETVQVPITMRKCGDMSSNVFNLRYLTGTNIIAWDVYGGTDFEFSIESGPIIYVGPNSFYDAKGYIQDNFLIKAYSSIFKITIIDTYYL
ncbi:MAG: hypothetical protein JXA20_02365 [Spirochaetes bacterium]|nr:hypothetical protein [Spirochaetota bacterium]